MFHSAQASEAYRGISIGRGDALGWFEKSLVIEEQVRGWGIAGNDGGLFWVQDISKEGKPVSDVRDYQTIKSGVILELTGLPPGKYGIMPYDTWQGGFLGGFSIQCSEVQTCIVPLPDFKHDMAFKIFREE